MRLSILGYLVITGVLTSAEALDLGLHGMRRDKLVAIPEQALMRKRRWQAARPPQAPHLHARRPVRSTSTSRKLLQHLQGLAEGEGAGLQAIGVEEIADRGIAGHRAGLIDPVDTR